jgi:hypothetical protein
LTLPFWQRALRPRVLAIVVYRNPLEVARSLASRNGMPKERALALWETYNRTLLSNAQAFPALIVSYEKLVADPVRTAEALEAFLTTHGLAISELPREEVRAFVDAGLRHSAFDAAGLESDADVTDSQRHLFRLLRSLEGSHEILGRVVDNQLASIRR